MSRIDDYFLSLGRVLREDFSRRRALVADSDVKGAGNERTLGDFIDRHFQAVHITYNKQVIDSAGAVSDEIDICACNMEQPAPETDLLIAEGISFVVQVKAVLTDDELDRVIRNAKQLKELKRRHGHGDVLNCRSQLIPDYVERIPYLAFAYTSQLSLNSAQERLISKVEDIPATSQPDALFILDRGSIVNCRDGSLGYTSRGRKLVSWVAMESGEQTLMQFVRLALEVGRPVQRRVSPLSFYFDQRFPFTVRALVEELNS